MGAHSAGRVLSGFPGACYVPGRQGHVQTPARSCKLRPSHRRGGGDAGRNGEADFRGGRPSSCGYKGGDAEDRGAESQGRPTAVADDKGGDAEDRGAESQANSGNGEQAKSGNGGSTQVPPYRKEPGAQRGWEPRSDRHKIRWRAWRLREMDRSRNDQREGSPSAKLQAQEPMVACHGQRHIQCEWHRWWMDSFQPAISRQWQSKLGVCPQAKVARRL